ncbi:MAG: MBOAT family protein [Clostridia bacterium]|nr:MBOAT family protein [Clostridia bacterium]
MLFNSYIFVFLFFPIVILGYFLLNRFKKFEFAKIFLTVASLYFYGYFNWAYLIIIVSSIIVNYIFSGILLSHKASYVFKQLIFIVAMCLNIGSLGIFKYYDFFIENFNTIFSTSLPLLNLLLPLGISFFTFQQLSYIIDSYKGDVSKYSFFDYALFVTYFPQLIAGPIVTHDEMVPQFADLSKKKFNIDNFSAGLYGFALGLGKKVIIADTLGLVVDSAFTDVTNLGTTNALLIMFAYTFQIYFDFSGYSDMAMGIGKMMNIDIIQNFNSPYKAIGIVDFWKRWHITLTRFFTRYIYIPLGGNRKGEFRTYINITIVYLVSGIWHGANWTFILWGILHGFASITTRLIDKKFGLFSQNKSKSLKAILWVLTFAFLNLTWVMFRADSIEQAFTFYKQLFSFNFIEINTEYLELMQIDGLKILADMIPFVGDYIKTYAYIIIFLSAFILSVFAKNVSFRIKSFQAKWYHPIVTAGILFWCIMSFAGESSFLYWNF